MKINFKNPFWVSLITLVVPITLQNLISSSLNMVDNLMIGNLGENSIASVGLVNQYFFIFLLALTGVNAGAGIFTSQFWGRKDITNIRHMLGLNLLLCLGMALVFFIPAFLFPQFIMKVFVKDSEVIHLGVTYLKIISITFLFTSISQAYSTTLRCIGIAKLPMYGSLLGVLTNAFLNWVLIFGHLGFPALGVAGAAIATSIGRLIEMTFILICAYKTNDIIPCKLKEIIGFERNFIKVYFQTSSSVIANDILWSLGITGYVLIYSKIGIREVASMQIATTVSNLFMVLSIGLASSAAIMIGTRIGAGDEELAMNYASKFGLLAPTVGLITGISLWFASPFIVSVFHIDSNTVAMTIHILKIMAVFTPLRFFNILMIVGVFRGGGDTTYAMLIEMGAIWLFTIPAGYFAAVYFKLPLEAVYTIICLEEIVKFVFEASRLRSRNWIRNIVADL